MPGCRDIPKKLRKPKVDLPSGTALQQTHWLQQYLLQSKIDPVRWGWALGCSVGALWVLYRVLYGT